MIDFRKIIESTTKRKRLLFAIKVHNQLFKTADEIKLVKMIELYLDGKVSYQEVYQEKYKWSKFRTYYEFLLNDICHAALSTCDCGKPTAYGVLKEPLAKEYYKKILEDMICDITFQWNNYTISKLAEVIYETQDYSSLPILSDALQEAGCDDSLILDHCKNDFHVKGCWLIDSILGKQ